MNKKTTKGFTSIVKDKNSSTPLMLLFILIVVCILLQIATSSFFTTYNMSTLIRTVAFTTIVAYGQTLVLLTGGIDLSVAGIAGAFAIIGAWLMVNTGLNPYLCLIITLAGGFAAGALNGFLITKVKLVPFIATLATGSIFSGVIYVITQGWPIQGIPASIIPLGRGMVGTVPIPTIIMIIIGVALVIMLKYFPFGRYIFAVGGNQTAAKIVGVECDKVILWVYSLSGLLAAFAGILITCRLGAAQPSVGSSWVMPSVTAAILGGTSLLGGKGSIGGTIVGSILMGVISNAIVLLQISAYWENIIVGLVVLAAVTIDRVRAARTGE